MAEKVLNIADKETLDLTYDAVLNVGNDVAGVQTVATKILSAVLDSSASFVTSDNVLKTFLSAETSIGSPQSSAEHKTDQLTLGTFTPKYDGSLRIKINTKSSSGREGILYVMNGSSQYKKVSLTKDMTYIESNIDIEVSKSITYTVILEQSYMADVTYCNYAAVCGDVSSSASADLL